MKMHVVKACKLFLIMTSDALTRHVTSCGRTLTFLGM